MATMRTTFHRCEECEEIANPEDAVTLYECGNCSGKSSERRCADCSRFAAKFTEEGCPTCEAGELVEVDGWDCEFCEEPIPADSFEDHLAEEHADALAEAYLEAVKSREGTTEGTTA